MSFRGHMASLCLQDPGDIPSQVTCDLPWSGPALSTDKGLKNICGLSALNRKRCTPPEPLESDSTAGGRWEQQVWAWAFRRVGRGQRLDLTVQHDHRWVGFTQDHELVEPRPLGFPSVFTIIY